MELCYAMSRKAVLRDTDGSALKNAMKWGK
jgi:hypothetical protein